MYHDKSRHPQGFGSKQIEIRLRGEAIQNLLILWRLSFKSHNYQQSSDYVHQKVPFLTNQFDSSDKILKYQVVGNNEQRSILKEDQRKQDEHIYKATCLYL